MKVTLFDFQKDALHLLRDKLIAARKFASSDNPQAIAFYAPTGSGKTIVMTALFEAILDLPDDQLAWPLDWQQQSDAVILWVSDMPELNEQTKLKIESKSDRIYRVNQLISIDSTFDAERLEGGKVYFVNTQKLGNDKLLTKEGDGRQYSIWTTLTNTAKANPDRFYVVIDEAHRGMAGGRGAKEAQTLMQRFLLGYTEVGLVKMPLVIGVSATPKRFMDLLEYAPHTVHKVSISPEDVRQSGLLKDRILIHHPASASAAEMTLLEEAARRWAEMTDEWAVYCKAEGEPVVWPILVVQVENGTEKAITKTNLSDALDVIENAIGRRLREGEAVHAMHDTGDMDVAGRRLRKIDASRIDADKEVGVVFFKTNLSTGWDCPRAEIMMSFRRAEDHTYIAQLLGRMVRTPMARRVERVAALNDVHLFLPYFDTKAVNSVVESLQNVEDVPPTETGSAEDLVVLDRRSDFEDVFEVLSDLVTYRVNASRTQSHLRRFISIARSLTLDEIDENAWEVAKKKIVTWLSGQVDALKSNGRFTGLENNIVKVGLKTLAVRNGSKDVATESDYSIDASSVDVDRLFEDAGRALSHGLHMNYWQENADRDALNVKVEVIVLTKDHASMSALESSAEVAFDELYDLHKSAIGKLKELRRSTYEKLRLATAKPTEIPWHLPDSIDFRRIPSAPNWERHLFVEADGEFKAELGTWEAGVLNEELGSNATIAWLRNVDRKPWSLEIPYETGGEIRPMFPDLVIIRNVHETYVVDILEPHNPNLADNFEKAVGLARFAEKHGHLFGRIQLIRKRPSPAGGEYYARLDINKTATQKQLLLITSNPQLDALFESSVS
ncbi:DEAD/DEAH box helicase [Massilia sp. DWR3-1-1]|uniref:DEAD/DEAH box helicase n=1 Tax=Massilia sp. DWR3-1-1 TaxID=2804559 RepID=UPI003CF33DB4